MDTQRLMLLTLMAMARRQGIGPSHIAKEDDNALNLGYQVEKALTGALAYYDIYSVSDMATAVTNQKIEKQGNFIHAWSDGDLANIGIRLNSTDNPLIYLGRRNLIANIPFVQFYLTYPSQSGKQLDLLIGKNVSAEVEDRQTSTEIVNTLWRLSSRLGSIATFDNRGEIIWLDDFEDNINKWIQTIYGAGGTIALSTEAARSGGKSAKLTTGAVSNNAVDIYREVPYLAESNWGHEISFAFPPTPGGEGGIVEFDFEIHKGTTRYGFEVRYNLDTRVLSYFDSAGAEQTLETLTLSENLACFHTIKIVCNGITKKWLRIILDNKEYDMRNIDPVVVTVGNTGDYLYFVEVMITTRDKAYSVYFDDAIITQKES